MTARLFATAAAVTATATVGLAGPALAQHAGHGSPRPAPAPASTDPHAGHGMEPTTAPKAEPQAGHDMAGHEMSGMSGRRMAGHGMSGHEMGSMTGFLGAYPMTRESSGTSWQPELSPHDGVHGRAGGWDLMGHVNLQGVFTDQSGPRGDGKTFVAGMVMGRASRPLGGGTLALRGMVSPDPFMGKRGYPLLLATGETADGREQLVDRQHPHDLFVELAASYSYPLGERSSLYLYGGPVGEPAFGPTTFMHRGSGMDNPEAPITHHWFDSTHITFGVVTAGVVLDTVKLEASSFRGREPDEHRFDIERPRLDSQAARVSWNPSPRWSLQASGARLRSPEQLEPEVDDRRFSVSASYTAPVFGQGLWSTTVAYGRKDKTPGPSLDAFLAETAVRLDPRWTVFARAEAVEQDELLGHHDDAHGAEIFEVGKLTLGAVRDFQLAEHVKLGLGASVSAFRIPEGLEGAYGDSPRGALAFLRLKIE